MPGGRTFTADRFFLELDGVPCGFVRSVEGGGVTADVVVEQQGTTFFATKRVGAPRYEEFVLQLDLSLDKAVYSWIGDMWTGKRTRRDGSISTLNEKLKAVSEREFFQALLTEVKVPALDAASKDAAHLTVKFAPEYTRAKKASEKTVKASTTKQKAWLASNFKLAIDNLDCTRVSKVDAFAVKQTVVRDAIGEARDFTAEPAKLDFPNLRITLAESSAQTWAEWFDDFVVKGNNDSTKERGGSSSSPPTERRSARSTSSTSGSFGSSGSRSLWARRRSRACGWTSTASGWS